ncbi:hypothetical protein BAE44_0022462 [Dichanthelium oligosanthes]|uniref:Gnk2-homologous domain-containing protein n=1 Tax=Dichanthelium oligosanthes TaxID=888268 RepID=A0A1E5UUD8_9POAL|nr:hypothetical protein BAE44_0022462 [Dichanthelium oligosanthes]
MEVVSVVCNAASYRPGDPFATSVAYMLLDLVSTTAAQDGRDYYDISGAYPVAFAYGHATCRPTLPGGDCETCLTNAVAQMGASRGDSFGATIVLVDCRVRYEHYARSWDSTFIRAAACTGRCSLADFFFRFLP